VASAPAKPRSPVRQAKARILVVGASTGGPNALETFLSGLPADYPLPIVVVQHMPVGFTRLLAERLTAHTPFVASEGETGGMVVPGRIWIAPGDLHLVLRHADSGITLQTNREAPENSCRPAVDVLFRSAVRVYGAGVLGVVLTGMGYDGLKGSEGIVAAGGQVLVQDEASSVVWGMPGAVARAGLASGILPLDALAEAVLQRTRSGLLLAAQS
jgi:two-component system chemotaxis response regulator CheB